MELKDFIAKLPLDIITKTKIYKNKIVLPAEIEKTDFYNKLKTRIEQPTITDEKAIYAALLARSFKTLKPIEHILLEKIKL